MQAILSEALPLTATPKGVNHKLATKLTLIYVTAPRLKNSVIAYLIVLSEYGIFNVVTPFRHLPYWACACVFSVQEAL